MATKIPDLPFNLDIRETPPVGPVTL